MDQYGQIFNNGTISTLLSYERFAEPSRHVEAVAKDTVQYGHIKVIPHPFSARMTSCPPMIPSYKLLEVT